MATHYKKCYTCWTIHKVGKPFDTHKCIKLKVRRDS